MFAPRATAALCLLLLLPGCADRVTGDISDGWESGARLSAHSLDRYHSGGYDARVFPDAGHAPPRPDHCVAYRGNASYAGDACTVLTPDSEHWFPVDGTDPPWGLWGKWEGRFGDTADDPDPSYPRRLVAFDADGAPVAHWDGAEHPRASHSTE